jgi:hypothetical protein
VTDAPAGPGSALSSPVSVSVSGAGQLEAGGTGNVKVCVRFR